ncbi:MAG: hypothetical protein H6Q55_2912 [Deltaproteobacteria bacterium]|nr:hypothetical protein [Deltaproteobacteria bacterium]
MPTGVMYGSRIVSTLCQGNNLGVWKGCTVRYSSLVTLKEIF